MNKDEMALIAAQITAGYNIKFDKQKMTLWFMALKDLPFERVQAAVIKLVQESRYVPTVADVRKAVFEKDCLTAGQAWAKAMKAVARYGMYNEAKALDSLDGPTREATENVGFRALCLSENLSIERAHFLKIYKENSEREEKAALVAPEVKAMLADTVKKLGGS